MENAIFKGDDTGAYGAKYLTIAVSNPKKLEISKLVVSINGGIIQKTFNDEETHFTDENIELIVNFDSTETPKLNSSNVANLVTYDMQGRQKTCQGSKTFYAKNGVIYNGRRPCC